MLALFTYTCIIEHKQRQSKPSFIGVAMSTVIMIHSYSGVTTRLISHSKIEGLSGIMDMSLHQHVV